jgi:hypothetical protein
MNLISIRHKPIEMVGLRGRLEDKGHHSPASLAQTINKLKVNTKSNNLLQNWHQNISHIWNRYTNTIVKSIRIIG